MPIGNIAATKAQSNLSARLLQTLLGGGGLRGVDLKSDVVAAKLQRGQPGGAGAGERIQHQHVAAVPAIGVNATPW